MSSSPSAAKCASSLDAAPSFLRHVKKGTDYEKDLPADLAERWNERFKIRANFDSTFSVTSTHLPENFARLSFPGTTIDVQDLYLHHRVRDRRFALHVAIAKGEKDIVDRILEIDPSLLVPNDAFRCAVRFSQSAMVEWLFPQVSEHQKSNWIRELERMLRTTESNFHLNIDVVETLHRLGFTWDALVYHCAQFAGVELLDHLYSNRQYASLSELLYKACKLKHGDLIKRAIQDHGFDRFNSWVQPYEARESIELIVGCILASPGHVYDPDILPWAHQAIGCMNLEAVDRLKEIDGMVLDDTAWECALRVGHPDIIRHFLPTRKDVNVLSEYDSIFAHDVDLAELLKSRISVQEIMPGTVEVARYLVENGVQFQEDILMRVLNHRENIGEKTWTAKTCENVSQLVHFILEIVPMKSDDNDPEGLVARHGCVELIKLFRQKTGNTHSYPLVSSALNSSNFLDLVECFIKEEGVVQFHDGDIRNALEKNDFDAMYYIISHIDPTCNIRRKDKYAVDILVQAKNVEQIDKKYFFNIIVEQGQLELVKEWVEANPTKFDFLSLHQVLVSCVHSSLVHIFTYLWPKYLEAKAVDEENFRFHNTSNLDKAVFTYYGDEPFEVELTKHINNVKAGNPFSGPWAEVEDLIAHEIMAGSQ